MKIKAKEEQILSNDSKSTKIFTITNPLLFLDIFFSRISKEKNLTSREVRKYKKWHGWGLMAILLTMILIIGMKITEKYKPELPLFSFWDFQNENVGATTEPLIQDILHCGWIDKLNQGLFTDARLILKNTKSRNQGNRESSIISVLNWITDLKEYFFERDPDALIIIFHDEIQIASLLKKWEMNKNEIRRVLNQITLADSRGTLTSTLDSGESQKLTQHHIYTQLDILQNQEVLYLGVIQDLKKRIKYELDADQPQALTVAIKNFKRRFPGIGGLEILEEDSSNYVAFHEAVKAEKWSDIQKMLDKMDFQTKIFANKIDLLLSHQKLSHLRDFFRDKQKNIVLLSKLKVVPDQISFDR